ncbi:MAG: hypothetical protein ABR923_17100 [Terracidiphilus sp.]|jgi:hypothetical protein
MKTAMSNTIHKASSGRLVALLVASLLILEPALPLRADALPLDGAPPQSLQIAILDGEGALNNISQRTAREPIVQVQDENHKPVAGALVLFAIHGGGQGASAAFTGGASTLSVVTDANGVAHAAGLVANQVKGPWQIQVTASYGKLTTSTVINENNVAPSAQGQAPPSKPPFHWALSKPTTIVGGVLVLGAIVAIVVVASNNNNSTNITPGGGTVGAPTTAVRPGIRFHF